MSRDSRQSGRTFDPVSANVYSPGPTRMSSGESAIGEPRLVLNTRVKSPRGMYTQERENQGHPQSVSDLVIEVRSEGGGDRLTPDMWIVHRGFTYYIKGKLPVDYKAGVTPYQVSTQNDTPRS